MLNKVLIFGLLLVFPFLDQARRLESLADISLSIDFGMFSTGHFDSYQMFMRVIVEDIVTYGEQLLTSALFFVPRSIWSSKSIGSGSLVANRLEFEFANISMNFFGEGYINFGYAGIMLFILLIAYFNARFDKAYWWHLSHHSALSIFYIVFLGLEFFLLRGDLLSGFSFTTGIFASTILVHKWAQA